MLDNTWTVQRWVLLKLTSLISPLREILFNNSVAYILLITFIFARCLHNSAMVTPVKYERDVIHVASFFMVLNNWENNGTDEIGSVTHTPVPPHRTNIGHTLPKLDQIQFPCPFSCCLIQNHCVNLPKKIFQISPTSVAVEQILRTINTITTMIAVYGNILLLRLATEAMPRFRFRTKFYLIQGVLVLESLQRLILVALAFGGVIGCLPPLNVEATMDSKRIDDNGRLRDDVIKWKHFSRYRPFVRGIHRSPVNSPQKDQRRGALMFYLICAWINGWVTNHEPGDLSRHRAHYDVIVMHWIIVA